MTNTATDIRGSASGEVLKPGNDPDLKAIIAAKRITTFFHPIVSMAEQKIIGVEALARGIDGETGGIVSPETLFNEARRNGLTQELDCLCREKALQSFARLFSRNRHITLWLNLDPQILDDSRGYIDTLFRQVALQDIEPRRVVIEIIESKVANESALLDFVAAYRRWGFLIAVDDWGTAYSNMTRIQQLRPDIIKIHHSLACRSDREIQKKELVRSMVGLSRGIGALVVVEGVENEEMGLAAMDLGAGLMQGFYFCKPAGRPEEIYASCEEKIRALSTQYKDRRIGLYNARRKHFKDLQNIMDDVEGLLSGRSFSAFQGILESIMLAHRELESTYVLDDKGIQITETVCSPRPDEVRNTFLFSPPGRGADRSMGNFFLLLRSGGGRFVSEPYTSPVTGKRCITVSRVTKDRNGRNIIICADCDCHEESLAVAQNQQS